MTNFKNLSYILNEIEPGRYIKTKEDVRRRYGIREGDKVKIYHRVPMTVEKKVYRATVYSVDEHHLTLEFPAKYRESLQWKQFFEEEKEALEQKK